MSSESLREIRVSDEYGDDHAIRVPVERPLAVLMDGETVGTLWTLGASPEWLVLGYLWNQQRVADVSSLESIAVDWSAGTDPAGLLIEGGGLPRLAAMRISRGTLLSVIEGVSQDESLPRCGLGARLCAL